MQLEFMITIVNRSIGEKVVDIFKENEVPMVLSTLGRGTASDDILSLLGFGEPEKEIIFCITRRQHTKKLMRSLIRQINIDIPGPGIAFTVPVKSVCGTFTMKYFSGTVELQREGEDKVQKQTHELIVAITNRGYTDMVMEAAHSAKATGGTVIHAKGTGAEKAEKFFGVSIAEDKELLFIVSRCKDKNDIMKAIIQGAGMNTKAKSMVFSLPVTDIVGLRHTDDDDEATEE